MMARATFSGVSGIGFGIGLDERSAPFLLGLVVSWELELISVSPPLPSFRGSPYKILGLF